MKTPHYSKIPRHENRRCPLCRGRRVQVSRNRDRRPPLDSVVCPNCGNFEIDSSLSDELLKLGADAEDVTLARYAGCHTRQAYEDDHPTDPLTLDNWQDLARRHTSTPVKRRRIRLLNLLVSIAGYRYEHLVQYELHDASNGFMVDEPHAPAYSGLVNGLVDRGHIRPTTDGVSGFAVTEKGMVRYQRQLLTVEEPPRTSDPPLRGDVHATDDQSNADLGDESSVEELRDRLNTYWKSSARVTLGTMRRGIENRGTRISEATLSRFASRKSTPSIAKLQEITDYLNSLQRVI